VPVATCFAPTDSIHTMFHRLAGEESCFIGCSYGGRNGGEFRFLLPDIEEEFRPYNRKRCALSRCACTYDPAHCSKLTILSSLRGSMPFCWCGQTAPPPPFVQPPPPPLVFSEPWSVATYAVQPDPFKSRVSALFKRIANAKMPDPALRASSHVVQCPGSDDCSNLCARTCSGQHLSSLRAFAVTGEEWTTHFTPKPPPSPPPSPEPPAPNPPPFGACLNSCEMEAKYEHQCRDGGLGSFFPSVCSFSTWCKICGPRADTVEVEQADTCELANNGVCEDGGDGSLFYNDPEGALTHLCGFGTDYTDCLSHGPRTILTKSEASFYGPTNVTRPTPPPPQPTPPSPPLPPPFVEDFDPCSTDPAAVCYAFFGLDGNLKCSGTAAQIDAKLYAGVCGFNFAGYVADPQFSDVCSDGGYFSTVIKRQDTPYEVATFACSYGSQCFRQTTSSPQTGGACAGARPKRTYLDCENTCGLDSPADLAFKTDNPNLPEVLDTSSSQPKFCRDGGDESVSASCPYGTMVRQTRTSAQFGTFRQYEVLTKSCKHSSNSTLFAHSVPAAARVPRSSSRTSRGAASSRCVRRHRPTLLVRGRRRLRPT
jgi:hypothetical protein